MFFTCRLGVGIPTKCSEGLHYSEEVTKLDLIRKKQKRNRNCFSNISLVLCAGWNLRLGSRQSTSWMWSFQGAGNVHLIPTNQQPDNNQVRKKKKKPAEQRATSAPVEKKTTAPRLSNGFVCPGGKLGVWIISFLCFLRSSWSELHPFFHPTGTHCSPTSNRLSKVLHLFGRDQAAGPGLPGGQSLQPDHLGLRRAHQRGRLRDLLQQARAEETSCSTSCLPGGQPVVL